VPVRLVDHPLAHDALLTLRDQRTVAADFRSTARRISLLIAVEALRDVPTATATVQTVLAPATGRRVSSDIVIVPVLRAGLGMLEAALEIAPTARVGYIGLRRDENTAVASRYYMNLPTKLHDSFVLLVDPMIATGGSAADAIDAIKAAGATHIRLACIVASTEGVATMSARHPDVDVVTPVIDGHLNDRKYIVPGLGDFGDRLYGTL
jgi:uracil phosphoribosyltransferase